MYGNPISIKIYTMNNQIIYIFANTISNFKLPQVENNKSNSKLSLVKTNNLNSPTKKKKTIIFIRNWNNKCQFSMTGGMYLASIKRSVESYWAPNIIANLR